MLATGTFEVQMTPQATEPAAPLVPVRFALAKQFSGDLQASSQGQMLAASTSIKTSAGYVAIERVEGTLQGRKGAFVLQHNGIMNRGNGQLTIQVVPDSGDGELSGLTGTMSIEIENGKHSYRFDYSLES